MTVTDDRALFKRLTLSLSDLNEAMFCLERLTCRGSFSTASEPDFATLRALHTTAVLAYARPFTANRATADVLPKLPSRLLKGYSREQRLLHERLLKLRNEHFAHSDPEPAAVRVWIQSAAKDSPTGLPSHWASMEGYTLNSADIEGLYSLLNYLWAAVNAERVAILTRLPRGGF